MLLCHSFLMLLNVHGKTGGESVVIHTKNTSHTRSEHVIAITSTLSGCCYFRHEELQINDLTLGKANERFRVVRGIVVRATSIFTSMQSCAA